MAENKDEPVVDADGRSTEVLDPKDTETVTVATHLAWDGEVLLPGSKIKVSATDARFLRETGQVVIKREPVKLQRAKHRG